ncbi:MAG: FIST N-terminal domain-containing protein [Eubacteriales bacterium]
MRNDFQVIIAHSTELDTLTAVSDIIKKSEHQLAGKQPAAGILYAGIDVDHQLVLDEIHQKWPALPLVGATTDGEFSSECEYVEDSLVLTLFVSEPVIIVSGSIDNTASDLGKECLQAFSDAVARLGQIPKLCILFSDVLTSNGESIMEQLTHASNGTLPIVGGISGDSWRFLEAKQFYNNVSSSHISSFLLLAGELDFSFGMDSGWEPVGETGTVTKSDNNIVYEINHMPTLDFYKNILGENTMPSLELPIAVYDEHDGFRFMRTTFENYDVSTGSVTYLGNVPVGSKVRITMVNRDSILAGTESSVSEAFRTFPSGVSPCIALCFSCSARRVLLGTRTIEECRIARKILGENVQFSGFYTYGEYCPNINKLTNEFHNETFVVVLLG